MEDLDAWRKTDRLSTRFVLTATLRDHTKNPRYAKPAAQVRDVEAAIKVFARRWWHLVSNMIDAEKNAAGMSVEKNGLAVRTFVSAGRALVHIERGDAYCCAIGEEGNPSRGLGLQGIGATKDEAIALWKDAAQLFADGAVLVADRGVGIG